MDVVRPNNKGNISDLDLIFGDIADILKKNFIDYSALYGDCQYHLFFVLFADGTPLTDVDLALEI